MTENENKIPWYSWLILTFHLIWSVGILWLTKGNVFPETLKWIVTIIFVVAASGLGLYDFVINKTTEGRDVTPLDPWTIVHTLAGVVFGFWYIPLIFVLITVIWWEAFEFSVKGFGEKEAIANRAVDVGVAVAGWLVVVVSGIIMTRSAFPIGNPVLN